MSRRVYMLELTINGRFLNKVIIDPHYEEKHANSVSDQVILKLVLQLDGRTFLFADSDEDGFQYFVNDHIELDKRFYKLIWLLHESESFVGIINAYRRKR